MPVDVFKSALPRYIANHNPEYAGKIHEVRDIAEQWLSYIPQTFPHFTRHTVAHSDALVRQLSNLLFRDAEPEKPLLPTLSAVEAYILVIASYLHDAGMVASDLEKSKILSSPEWSSWIQTGPGAKRWAAIEEFRQGPQPNDQTLRNFLADTQVRYVISDFIRRSHHLRVQDLITQSREQFARSPSPIRSFRTQLGTCASRMVSTCVISTIRQDIHSLVISAGKRQTCVCLRS